MFKANFVESLPCLPATCACSFYTCRSVWKFANVCGGFFSIPLADWWD